MASTIHANARTTPRIRREIQMAPSSVSNAALARRYGIHRHTVAKWRKRVSTEDASARPHRLCTTLTEAQEQVVVAIRELLLLPLDDLLVVVREFIEPCLSRSALDRCLRRHGVSDLRTLQRERDGDKAAPHPPKRSQGLRAWLWAHPSSTCPRCRTRHPASICSWPPDRATRWVYRRSAGQERQVGSGLPDAPSDQKSTVQDPRDPHRGKEFTAFVSALREKRQPTGDQPLARPGVPGSAHRCTASRSI